MEKFKEYFKVFAYIFYPGMVLILYLAQGLEGKLGLDLIFCPTDIIVLLAILGIYMLLDAFKVFDTVYVMTNGGPGNATEMLPNYIYKQGLKFFDAGYSAALAIVFVVIMTLVTVGFLKMRDRMEAQI